MTEQEALDTAARGGTTITDAHRAEARRRLANLAYTYAEAQMEILAQALAEDAWTPPVDPEIAAMETDLDWLLVARMAGEHGIRYRTNKALVQFLLAIKRSKGQ